MPRTADGHQQRHTRQHASWRRTASGSLHQAWLEDYGMPIRKQPAVLLYRCDAQRTAFFRTDVNNQPSADQQRNSSRLLDNTGGRQDGGTTAQPAIIVVYQHRTETQLPGPPDGQRLRGMDAQQDVPPVLQPAYRRASNHY